MRRWAAAILLLALLTAAALTEAEPASADISPRGYVLVQTPTVSGWLPLPTTEAESYTFPIRQIDQDGLPVLNILRLTPEGVCMESANCENQDCVEQGMVTLENREQRLLMNIILCLPHQVTIALYTPEEALAIYSQMTGGE